ncbi:MAG: FAD-binding oxidoreductase [Inquilinaceae bacterium]
MAELAQTSDRNDTLDRLKDIVGPKGWTDDPDAVAPHVSEWRGILRGATPLVLRPASTDEVSGVVALCHAAGIGIVPQGGNTGLVAGALPAEHGRDVVLSLQRMNRIRALDPVAYTMVAEAGVVLQAAQQAAADADRLFPLSLGAEGTCQIGGVLSTNAGGTGVLRYGNARDLVLGLEAVLPDGRVWQGLRTLRKDNTGYDLKHLFIGAEGTLGIVTAAALKLFPRPRQTATALAAVADPDAAIALLAQARGGSGDALTAFELMPRAGLDLALRHVADTVDPLAEAHPWYVLMEMTSTAAGDTLGAVMEAVLADAFEAGLVRDATIAASETQGARLWRLREAMVEGIRLEGVTLRHDVAVPVVRVPELIAQGMAAVSAALPGVRPVPFGHAGDGNIHFNFNGPPGMDPAAVLARVDDVAHILYDIVASLGGSFSAEHGIGRVKRGDLTARKTAVELDLMRTVKHALDPAGIMNPGKVL